MKNLSLFNVLFMALAIFALSSCGGDDTADPVFGADLTLLDGNGFISADADLAPGASFTVNLSATKGDNEMASLTVYENNLTLDASRITFAHTSTANNPQIIADTDRDALNWEITIEAQSDASIATYEFEITDAGGNTGTISIDINTDSGVTDPLEVTLSAGTNNCIVADFVESSMTTFCLNVSAAGGNAELDMITFFEDNTEIDVSRLVGVATNPMTLEGDDRTALSDLTVSIQSHSDAGARQYRAVVTDVDGNTAETGIFVTIGTEVSESTGILLLNAGGPMGTGGLNLETGVGSGSNDPDSHIKDEGIDVTQPLDANWIQRISGINGCEIRFANNLPEGFKFENVAIKEEIQGAFDSADVLSGNMTGIVSMDDEFIVKNGAGDKYFYLKVTNVNITTDNNEDSYTFDIKQ